MSLHWRMTLAIALIVAMSRGDGVAAAGLQQSDEAESTVVPDDAQMTSLAKKLESKSFQERQRAAAEILKAGAKAVPALTELSKTGSSEVRVRAAELLTQIREVEFDARVRQLEADRSTDSAKRLPEWDRFSSIAGETPDIIAAYLELLNAEPRLFSLRMFEAPELPAELERRASELASQANDREDVEFPVSSYIGVLLIAGNDQIRLPRATSTNLTLVLNDIRLQASVEDGVHRELLRRVIGSWMLRPGIAADRLLQFAVTYSIPEGRQLAERIITARSVRPEMISAVMALRDLGSPEENLPLVEGLLTVDSVLWPTGQQTVRKQAPAENIESRYQLQTRDIALAVALHLRGLSPVATRSTPTLPTASHFGIDTMGFESNDERETAISSYLQKFVKSPE
ncbi:MAG: hypothetical protein JNL58_13600 [Planctomyces sp.]|nr:hypothetical protein [Planctomyces sp.]